MAITMMKHAAMANKPIVAGDKDWKNASNDAGCADGRKCEWIMGALLLVGTGIHLVLAKFEIKNAAGRGMRCSSFSFGSYPSFDPVLAVKLT